MHEFTNQLLASGTFKSRSAYPPLSLSQITALPSGKETKHPASRRSPNPEILSDTNGLTDKPRVIPRSDTDFANALTSGNLAVSHENP